ncbi:hypothetical protein ACS0TY_029692 [Phlomoides rotata]
MQEMDVIEIMVAEMEVSTVKMIGSSVIGKMKELEDDHLEFVKAYEYTHLSNTSKSIEKA